MRPSISSTRKGSVSNVATLFTTYSLYISTIALASRKLTFRIIFISLKQSDPGKNLSLPGPDLSSSQITIFSKPSTQTLSLIHILRVEEMEGRIAGISASYPYLVYVDCLLYTSGSQGIRSPRGCRENRLPYPDPSPRNPA